jgi:multidrug resistance protein
LLLIVFITVFLDLVGFGIIIPIQPFFAEFLGARPSTVTLLMASFSFMQFLFAPFWGHLSDRVGRRPVMLASIFITSSGYFLFALSSSLTMLFAARMLSGFGSANIGTAQAIIADSTPPEKRAKGMGIIGVAFGLGFILGPALGGLLSQVGMATPAFIAGGLSAANFVLASIILPETRRSNTAKTRHSTFSLVDLRSAIQHPNVAMLMVLCLGYSTSFALMEGSLGLFIQNVFVTTHGEVSFKEASRLTSFVLIVVGVAATIVQGCFIGMLVKKFGEMRLMRFGIFSIALTMCAIPVLGALHRFDLFLLIFPFMALGTGTLNPSLASLLSTAVHENEQGGTLGLGQGLASLGRVFGPSAAGILFEWNIGTPFFVSSILLMACLTLTLRIRINCKPSKSLQE